MKKINQSNKLLEIGSKVNIDVSSIEDRLPEGLEEKLNISSSGTVIGYKITDGTQIGFLLELEDGSKNWFFKHELIYINNQKEQSQEGASKSNKYFLKQRYIYKGDKLSYVLNPINFASWLINASKDIV